MHTCPDCGDHHKERRTDKQRIEALEREVAELRARPLGWFPILPICTRPHYPQITWPYQWSNTYTAPNILLANSTAESS